MEQDFSKLDKDFDNLVKSKSSSTKLPPIPKKNSVAKEIIGASKLSEELQIQSDSEQIVTEQIGNSDELQTQTENALLLDHLSLAKEENTQIIQLARDSVAQITQLSKEINNVKDELINAKDQQIAALESDIDNNKKITNKIKQENQDLQMLIASLQNKK